MTTKTTSFVLRLFSVFMLLVLIIGAWGVTSTHAAGLMVNSLADTTAIDRNCTLREAIQNANNYVATNTNCAMGNSGAIYNKDYVELFNRGPFTTNMRGPASTSASILHPIPPIPVVADLTIESSPEITCGQTIMDDTTLVEDLACPPDTEFAIVIGASNITLDLGGHTISGYTPRTGVFATGQEGITIRNGSIDGFNVGVYIDQTNRVTMENLTVRNLDISDPNHFIFGIAVVGSQEVVVRDSLFEFLTVAHKESVEIFDSFVDVNNIEVRGGGAGVSFSFLGEVCDPVNSPSNGTVRNSKFSDIYIAGIWIACSSSALIEGNDFSGCQDCMMGIQGDAPFLGAVTGLMIKDNFIHDTFLGIEFRGITQSSILNNYVFDNEGWGIAMRQSLGCLAPEPGWECFYSTANLITNNDTWGNFTDLYHYEDSLGNTWERNTCETKDGAEIPECPPIVKSIVRASANPSSETNVDFTVIFSKPVTGIDTADFKLTNTILTGASITGVTGTGTGPYTVTVDTGTGNGTLRLDVLETATIQDSDGNAFMGPYTRGETYAVYKGTAPTVPALTSPANNALVASYMPTLDWNDSSEVMALTVLGWHYEINVTSPFGYNQTFNTVDNSDPLVGLGASQYTFTSPLPANTIFTWKVRAYNDNNQYSAWSTARTFRTMVAVPALNLPTNGTTENNKRPAFSWGEVSGATSYTLQILNGAKVAVTGTITAPLHTYTPTTDLLPGTTYTWKVKANGTNAGIYSEPFTFTTSSNPPKVSVLTLPANAALVDSALVQTLKWSPVLAVVTTVPASTYPAAASYQVEYATNSAFTDSRVVSVNGNTIADTQLALAIGTLSPNLTYSWRVRSWSGPDATGNHSVWSTARTFRTKPPSTKLATPALSSPADLVTLNNKRPTFSWSAVSGATSYTLQILKGATVTVTRTITVPLHTYTPTADLLPNTTYTWKVKANGLISSDYSTPFIFTTSLNAPKVPVLFTPTANALVDSAVPQTLDWNPVLAVTTANSATTYPAAVGYDVEYATNSAFVSSTLVNVAAPDSQHLIASLLPANTTFYWRVRSYNITGQDSAWSATRIFKTRLSTPALNLPADLETLENKRPTFSWDEVPGATTYTLQILKKNPTTNLFTVVANTGTIKVPAYTYTPTVDLLPSTPYTWKVKANGTNTGNYSAPFTFTTSGNPPKIPVLSAPANGSFVNSTVPQTLDWNPVLAVNTTNPATAYPAAASFEVEYAMNSSFTGASDTLIIVNDNTTLGTHIVPITLLPGRSYYWHVRSWSGAGATGNHSAWSAVRTIKVKFVAPTLTTPSSGATVGVRPTFTWSSGLNGVWTSYTLQVANNTAFTVGLRSFTIKAPTTTYTILATLPPLTSGTKYWRVKINGLYVPITSAYQNFIVP